ncbi:MAG TPA: hemolysin family protein [Candidatus Binatia bacterium]|jgi:putative hemolysin|nr:hemolysin family protein [Candidatus Binatia bacterium]
MPGVTFEIAIVLLLILVNGIFAMSEIAIVSARRVRLERMARNGNRGAQRALELVNTPNRLLSTVQVGITLVGIFAGAFGGATIADELADVLSRIGPLRPYAASISLALVVGIITFLSVVVGELVPKRIALQNPERVSSLVARPMELISLAAAPIVRLLSLSTEGVLRLLGIEARPQSAVTEEEIRVLVEQGAQAGMIEEVERDMVESIFRLDDRPLEAMMTPRLEIVWLDVNNRAEENRRLIETSTFTRFPVCDGSLDNVLGIVHSKDLLSNCLDGRPLQIAEAMRPPLFVPETVHALRALERFKQSGIHMALLIDEYGGIEGLVTLFDILEAIVGDIPTLGEQEDQQIVQREDGTWLVDGLLPIDEFMLAFDLREMPAEGSYQTLGGFMVLMLGNVPSTGEYFEWHEMRFEVADMDGHRVDKILIAPAPSGDGQ